MVGVVGSWNRYDQQVGVVSGRGQQVGVFSGIGMISKWVWFPSRCD